VIEYLKISIPKKKVLFDSQVMGKAKKNSDLDLLVIIERHNPLAKLKRRDRYVEVLRLFQHKGFGLDAIVLTEDEVQKIINENEGEWDLILDILNQGKTLYEQKAETK
jgi:predicted nucleotidyltransferase